MINSVYGKGKRYNATTYKANGITNQLISLITIKTPDIYKEHKSLTIPALWDTGATRSCISKKYANELGLVPIDFQDSFGVDGMHTTPVYDLIVDLNEYVKGIRLSVTEANLHKEDGGPPYSNVGFLLGMDIISLGDFFTGQYKDEDGLSKTMFSFRFPSALDPTDYLKEIQEYNKSVEIQRNLANNKRNFNNFVGKKKKR